TDDGRCVAWAAAAGSPRVVRAARAGPPARTAAARLGRRWGSRTIQRRIRERTTGVSPHACLALLYIALPRSPPLRRHGATAAPQRPRHSPSVRAGVPEIRACR